MRKIVKSQFSEWFKPDPVDEKAQHYVSLLDMVICCLATPTHEDYEVNISVGPKLGCPSE